MLTGKQRSYLRSLGNTIDPIVQVGKGGIDDTFIIQINEALEARELIKLTVLKNSEFDAWSACDEICRQTGAEPVQVIGNRFIIYRRSKEKPTIQLPPGKSK